MYVWVLKIKRKIFPKFLGPKRFKRVIMMFTNSGRHKHAGRQAWHPVHQLIRQRVRGEHASLVGIFGANETCTGCEVHASLLGLGKAF